MSHEATSELASLEEAEVVECVSGLCSVLEGAQLVELVTGDEINEHFDKCQKTLQELNKITGESLSEIYDIEILLNSIKDPECDQVNNLLQCMHVSTFNECVDAMERRATEVRRTFYRCKRKELKNTVHQMNKKPKHN